MRTLSSRAAVRIEPIEGRTLLAMAFIGDEFRVNTITADSQALPALAIDEDGSYVVAWKQGDLEYTDINIYARRYDASGAPIGSEFLVNQITEGRQEAPAVALEDDGDFIVVWISDGEAKGVYGRRYFADGTPQADQFRINSITGHTQVLPSVAVDEIGTFMVTWLSRAPGEPDYHVRGRRYEADGFPTSFDFAITEPGSGDQRDPVVVDGHSDFLVAWSEYQHDGPNGVFARHYDNLGPIDDAFQVDDGTDDVFRGVTAASWVDGSSVIAWSSVVDTGAAWEIHARRYDRDNVPIGDQFRVNSFTTHRQSDPSIAFDSDGDFMVVWASIGQDGNQGSVVAKSYDANGVARGEEFVVNTYTPRSQSSPRIALDFSGKGVIVWQSDQQDGSRLGVYAQRIDTAVETATLDNGVLVVHGSPADDDIRVVRQENDLQVIVNGETFEFDVALVQRIELYADKGNDRVTVAAGVPGAYILGGLGNDTLTGGDGNDSLVGAAGLDSLRGGGGSDRVAGGKHADILVAEDGDDRVYGDDGADRLDGGNGRDRMYGGADNDTMLGSNQNDTLYGESGNDSIHGGNHSDRLFPGSGSDTSDGGGGDDLVFDADGSIDKLIGGTGVDGHDSDANDLIRQFEFVV